MDDRVAEAVQNIQAAFAVSQQNIIKYIAAADGLTEAEVKEEVVRGIAAAMAANKIKRTTQGAPQGTQGSFVLGRGSQPRQPLPPSGPHNYEVYAASSSSSSSSSSNVVVVDLKRPATRK